MTRIKICGITNEEDALFSAECGADFLGFIFVPVSPRFVEPEKAGVIAARIRERGHTTKIVGVFRDVSTAYIGEITKVAGLDFVQLHGSEDDDEVRELTVPSIKALHVADSLPDTGQTPSAEWLLFDTYDARRAGGTGRTFDWSLLSGYDRSKPFFLSGGLDPENAAAAIALVRPDAIDVASGVEISPGVKDHAQVARLFERVRRA